MWRQEAHAIIRWRGLPSNWGKPCWTWQLVHAGGRLRLVSSSAGRQSAMQELWLQRAQAQNTPEGTTRRQPVCGGAAGPQPRGCTRAAVQSRRCLQGPEQVQARTAQETHIVGLDVTVDELEIMQVATPAGHVVQHLLHKLCCQAPAATPHKLWADVSFERQNSSASATGADGG